MLYTEQSIKFSRLDLFPIPEDTIIEEEDLKKKKSSKKTTKKSTDSMKLQDFLNLLEEVDVEISSGGDITFTF
jgi:hypothetical protein